MRAAPVWRRCERRVHAGSRLAFPATCSASAVVRDERADVVCWAVRRDVGRGRQPGGHRNVRLGVRSGGAVVQGAGAMRRGRRAGGGVRGGTRGIAAQGTRPGVVRKIWDWRGAREEGRRRCGGRAAGGMCVGTTKSDGRRKKNLRTEVWCAMVYVSKAAQGRRKERG